MCNSNELNQILKTILFRRYCVIIGSIVVVLFFSILFIIPKNQSLPQFSISFSKGVNIIQQNIFTITQTSTTTTTSSPILNITLNRTYATTLKSNNDILCNSTAGEISNNSTRDGCEQSRCKIILRASGGRLGNRMFIYASAYGLARTHNCRLHVFLMILEELSAHFQLKPMDEKMWLPYDETIKLKNVEIKSSICQFYPELLRPNALKNIEMQGYWQSYLYFDAYRDEIRQIFTARNETLDTLARYFTNINRDICRNCDPLPNTTQNELRHAFRTRYNTTWIGVHVREADFRGLGYSSDSSYLFNAMTFFRRRYHDKRVRFLVASDDKIYCQQLFKNFSNSRNIFVLPDQFPPGYDMMALSFCHHSIITGGTFGFWAAYLAGGEVIHDNKYQAECQRTDYYPPWFLLTGETVEKKH